MRVDLKPGDAATADVRFSPDVPGGSEQTDGPCEPKAYTLRLTVGDGTVDAPIVPPTPVCERGSLQLLEPHRRALVAGAPRSSSRSFGPKPSFS